MLGLIGLSLVLGCGAKPVSPSTSGTRAGRGALGAAGAGTGQPAKTGPVEVSYFGPQGETEGRVEISVSFDRPMVPLGTVTEVGPHVLTLEPKAAGSARWVGSQTLLFEPSVALPMGTEFKVHVARELRALDGRELATDLDFSFATPALTVVSERSSHGSDYTNRRWVDVYFNQSVAPDALREHVVLEQTTNKKQERTTLAFTVVQPEQTNPRWLRVVSKTPFALSSLVTLRVTAGLRGTEGPRPLAKDAELHHKIYGPLHIVQAPPCAGEMCVAKLVFSNPVRTRAVYAKLRFDPPLPTPLSRSDDYETHEVYFGSELAPDTTYRISVEGALTDVYGTRLEGERTAVVQTPPYPELARLLLDGELVHAAQVPKLRVQLQNTGNVWLDLTPLKVTEVLPQALDTLQPRAPAVTQALGGAKGTERKVVEVDPSAALKAGKGVVLATLDTHQAGEEPYTRRLIAYTDLAPALKASSTGGVVWVTRFSDAQPVAGASVRVVLKEQTLATGQTDAQGLFAFKLAPRVLAAGESESYDDRDLVAVVQKDDDVSFTQKFRGVGPWELTEHGSYGGEGTTSAHLFTERGIYRPGDTLQLKGILRSHDKNAFVPTAGEVTVRAVDASESEIEISKVKLSAFGTFSHAVRIPGSVELGPITLTVTSAGQTFTASAEVAEYRPAELEVALRADRELGTRGETVQARIAGHYLFGAPAREASMYWSARYLPRSFEPERYAGFTFADEDDESWHDHPYNVAASGEGKLDAKGELEIEASLEGAPLHGPSSLEIETSVVSHGTQAAASIVVDVVPASVLVGLRPASALGEVQKPLVVELTALSPQAAPVADVPLEVSFKRRDFTSKLVDGRVEYQAHDQRVGSCRVKSKVELARCTFTPTLPGLHVARVRGKDDKGRESTAARYVYVYGDGAASWGGDQDSYLLSLKSDKTRFQLGDTAKLLVPSPWDEAEALITVEREGVLSVERKHVGRASTIEVRIDERFVPNAFVSVLLVRPLDGVSSGVEAGLPYRVGALELSADVSARKLSIEVRPDAIEKRPGEELTVELAVRDGTGKATPAELTVFAVDEGVLSLTGYRTPDPFAQIYAPRALSVWTSDARGMLAHVLDGADEEKGGDEGGGGGESVRSNFAAVALYVPSLLTDAAGKASLRFKLPDGTTRYRIMAVAASRGAEVGSGEASVRTKKPLMLRPLVPRVLRAGDKVELGVLVHNEQTEDIDAEVELTATGIALVEGAKKRVHVPASGAVEVRYRLHADRVGAVQLSFRAQAGKERDALAIERRVLSPSVLQTVSGAGTTQATAQEALAPLAGLRRDVGGLEVSLATSALVELEAPTRALLAYEYGCTEQLSSRLIALAALERLRVPLSLSDASFAGQAASLASELERHQRGDGGFGLWSPNDSTSPVLSTFLTSYALIALSELKAAGLPVSPHAYERALKFLASELRAPRPGSEDADRAALRLTQQAFTVYALAVSGHYDAGYAGKLFEQRALLPVSAQVELMHALANDPMSDGRVETLLAELSSHVRVTADEAHLETNLSDAYAPLFISDVRSTSALLLALLARHPEHTLLPKLARWLSGARGRDGAFRGTHESAWGVRALSAYFAQQEATRPDLRAKVTLGAREIGKSVLVGSRAKASFSVPMSELPTTGEPLTFDKQGSGTLHYVMRLGYATSELPTLPSERGFFVERSYERIDPALLASGDATGEASDSAAVGDYVRITLRVAVPSARRFVLITDPLPAGLEPVDMTLATELQGARRALDHEGQTDHQELRDDRAVFAIDDLAPGLYRYTYLARANTVGSFVAPPTKVEEMYHPETQGLTAAHAFTVRAP
ncbi:MAG: hypothetical protein RLZZ450_1389 [Pseudomonadota bacterium]